MSSAKLHLKETPAERRERDLHRARKAAKKRRRQDTTGASSNDEAGPSHTKRHHANPHDTRSYVFLDEEDEYGPPPPSSYRAEKPDYDRIQAELEEARFREKMFGALEDDERLDSLESRLNDYAHVPRRWRGGGMERMDDELGMDPGVMEDEAYAEWVREGMWRCVYARFKGVREAHAARMLDEKTQRSMKSRSARRLSALRGRRKGGLSGMRPSVWNAKMRKTADAAGVERNIDGQRRLANCTTPVGRNCLARLQTPKAHCASLTYPGPSCPLISLVGRRGSLLWMI